jgi:hypothetical protein
MFSGSGSWNALPIFACEIAALENASSEREVKSTFPTVAFTLRLVLFAAVEVIVRRR